MTEYRLPNCQVVDSSGCHRYDYWNEQSLFDGDPHTGWCSPSRTRPTVEYLRVETNDGRPVSAIRMLARSVNEDAGFPRTVAVEVPSEGGWARVRTARDLRPRAGTWIRLEIPPTRTPVLMLRLADAAIRPDGRQFTQFMCLELTTREQPNGQAA
jgi:hypothetical protein